MNPRKFTSMTDFENESLQRIGKGAFMKLLHFPNHNQEKWCAVLGTSSHAQHICRHTRKLCSVHQDSMIICCICAHVSFVILGVCFTTI